MNKTIKDKIIFFCSEHDAPLRTVIGKYSAYLRCSANEDGTQNFCPCRISLKEEDAIINEIMKNIMRLKVGMTGQYKDIHYRIEEILKYYIKVSISRGRTVA